MEEKQKLNAPRDFLRGAAVTRPSSPALLTPSHFTVTCATNPQPRPPDPPTLGQTHTPDPWVIITRTQQELQELRRENQRLLLKHKDTSSTQYSTHHTRYTHSPEQLRRDSEELRGEVKRLKEELRERERNISRQCAEREELSVELLHCKDELKQNREKLAECVLQREQSERELQCSKEETQRLQEQVQQVCESHSAEISALTHTNTHLQSSLTAATQEVTLLRQNLEEVISEKEMVQEQLSSQSSVIAEQADTLQKLRSYIGTRSEEEKQHTLIQKLEKEKEALIMSVELLKVRVQASNDILALQERELGEQSDPLHKDSRAGQLLSLWREKVFVLLVQLRSRDLQLHSEKSQLHNTVCDLQQDVQKLQSQISVFQHSLQDKTAELELHNIHSQELKQQLCRAVEENEILKEEKDKNEKSLRDITNTAHRVCECVEQCRGQMDSAQFQMNTLAQRLSFATKRLDTVHGLLLRKEALRKAQQATKPPDPPASDSSCIERLKAEVALLSSERDQLTQELKRTPDLIQSALSDLQQQLERQVGHLTQALSCSKADMEECELRRVEAQRQCEEHEATIVELQAEVHSVQQQSEEQEGTISELRAEAHRIQQHWQTVLQEKVSEVEGVHTRQLREMETQLNTARREHTKAVVALRQVERSAMREREQEREAERARSEHTHKNITHLQTQLKEKDKDRNILLAVVQQQGLMNEYRRIRRVAIQSPKSLQEHKQQQQKQHQQLKDAELKEGSVLSMLGEVRSLSSAVIHSSEGEEDEDDEEGQRDRVTHTN
ncbi:coiled-coil alpha-helical rod protein 1 [Astyanax mexicanus]|uniref:coiled-coil alpha-helical rod protein 1 n=1 Tax=Astyanax mexicanus TaxID=7994 RepID=UPI0020CAA9C7|nr:coiled-coil alpha-helical rod protein 1 [Astyanax mexicanus]